MKNSKNTHIKASDFAKLCGTNRRTLLHYDAIGLFSPAGREENGYRYYREDQYDVFLVITALKELGMPLEEIKSYLEGRNPQSLLALLQAQQAKVRLELERLERIETIIATKKGLLELGAKVQCNKVIFEAMPEEQLVLSEPIFSSDPQKTAPALYAHLAQCQDKHLNIGYPFGAMLAQESLLRGAFDEYAYYFTKTDCAGPYFHKPAGLYATIYWKGDYLKSAQAFEMLLAEIQKAAMQICGFGYKEGIIDEIAQRDKSCYITKISIPVQQG